jgi:hypothetical protein
MATMPKHVGVKNMKYIYIYNVQLYVCWCQRNIKVNLLLVWNENCALLVQYAQYTSDSLPKFRDNKSATSSRQNLLTLENWTNKLSGNIGKNYHYRQCNISEDRSSYVLHCGKLSPARLV